MSQCGSQENIYTERYTIDKIDFSRIKLLIASIAIDEVVVKNQGYISVANIHILYLGNQFQVHLTSALFSALKIRF